MPEPSLRNADITGELKEEIELFRALKPYLAHCLTLNHEVNNLLAGVIGYAEFLLLDKEQLTDNQRKSLQEIMRCAERMRKLVGNLCEEKIALAEKVDLSSVVARYEQVARPLD